MAGFGVGSAAETPAGRFPRRLLMSPLMAGCGAAMGGLAPNTPPAVAAAAVKGGLVVAANGLADGIAPFNGAPKRVPETAGLGAK